MAPLVLVPPPKEKPHHPHWRAEVIAGVFTALILTCLLTILLHAYLTRRRLTRLAPEPPNPPNSRASSVWPAPLLRFPSSASSPGWVSAGTGVSEKRYWRSVAASGCAEVAERKLSAQGYVGVAEVRRSGSGMSGTTVGSSAADPPGVRVGYRRADEGVFGGFGSVAWVDGRRGNVEREKEREIAKRERGEDGREDEEKEVVEERGEKKGEEGVRNAEMKV
ncbi:hypothetical protein BU16DRAFT_539242 [Lophium mytilinum]|uniref:Uncharacterized protein n=1 Tax=Lophium mytilinum TaxID=390894 RepID=A0A6A6QS65_9PEZI|nr:hypothetical protein BU16DRAFT_539242 [Lophium mytilinum]